MLWQQINMTLSPLGAPLFYSFIQVKDWNGHQWRPLQLKKVSIKVFMFMNVKTIRLDGLAEVAYVRKRASFCHQLITTGFFNDRHMQHLTR